MVESEINYFTTIEDHFRLARRTPLFMLSPRDWELLETWKNAGIPVVAVIRGIDVAFENRRRQPARARIQEVNSLSYCTQAVLAEARAMVSLTRPQTASNPQSERMAVQSFIAGNADTLRKRGYIDLAESLDSLDLDALFEDSEQLEQSLTTVENILVARVYDSANDETLTRARHAVDSGLKQYREKMTRDQIAALEKQLLESALLKSEGLPRLSLLFL